LVINKMLVTQISEDWKASGQGLVGGGEEGREERGKRREEVGGRRETERGETDRERKRRETWRREGDQW